MGDEAARWWGEPGGGPRPDPPGWWPEPDSLHWVRSPEPAGEPAGHDRPDGAA
ncbi:hypothetical protein [Amycolatopsis sp. lyj-109]|uniref:hypothetical protein n=1 Tax=Amycolatopsis sp. lyj-109 TaxID=2789287 RepID=UPI00397CF944